MRAIIQYLRFFLGKGTAQRIFAAVVALLLLLGLILGGRAIAKSASRFVPAREGAIYLEGGLAYYAVAGKKAIRLYYTEGCASVVGANGENWWFTAPGANNSEIYDLYYMESGKAPKLRVHGVQNWLQGDYNAERVLYKIKGAMGEVELRCLTAGKKKKDVRLAVNVESVYMPEFGDSFWYTKKQYGGTSLWRVDYKGDDEMLENNVTDITLAQGERKDTPQLLYLRNATKDATNKICLLNQGSDKINELAADVDEESLPAFLGDYVPGGNLYYFKKQQGETASWQDILKDKYAESDAALKEPNKEDFFSLFGLWSPGYDSAVKEYNAKLTRDRVRHALNELNEESKLFPNSKMLCVWTGKKTYELCNVAEDELYAKRGSGEAGVIAALREPQATNADIADYAARTGDEALEDIIKEARTELEKALGQQRLYFVLPGSSETQFTELDEVYVPGSAAFEFTSNGKKLYGIITSTVTSAGEKVEKQNIYLQRIESSVISAKEEVKIGVQQARILGDALWCVRPSNEGKVLGELVRIEDGKEEELVAEYVSEYKGDEETGVLIFHHPASTQEPDEAPRSRLSVWIKGKVSSINGNTRILCESVKSYGKQGIVFAEPKEGKDELVLKLWKNGKLREISSNAQKLLVF